MQSTEDLWTQALTGTWGRSPLPANTVAAQLELMRGQGTEQQGLEYSEDREAQLWTYKRMEFGKVLRSSSHYLLPENSPGKSHMC